MGIPLFINKLQCNKKVKLKQTRKQPHLAQKLTKNNVLAYHTLGTAQKLQNTHTLDTYLCRTEAPGNKEKSSTSASC